MPHQTPRYWNRKAFRTWSEPAGPTASFLRPPSAVDGQYPSQHSRTMETLESILAKMPPPVRVLEAGGGSTTRVQIPGASYVVIDISPEQLARNTYADEKLLGDLQTFDYGPARFDVALFWDVLEHLKEPGEALKRAAA